MAAHRECQACCCGGKVHEGHEGNESHGEHRELPGWLRLAAGAVLYAIALLYPGEAPLVLYLPAYVVLGGQTVWKACRNLIRGRVLDEHFLMTLATLGAFGIGEYPEAVAVMLFYEIGELLQDLAVDNSRRSIAALIDLRPDYANLVVAGNETTRVNPEGIEVGQHIVVRPGERVPLDGEVVSGESLLDTSALTGESVPRLARPGDTVLAGYINRNGVLMLRVTTPFHESTAARVMRLVTEAGNRKAATERFITRFARVYTPAVVGVAAALAVVPPLVSPAQEFATWFYRALIFLVVSCPCALVVSIPLGFFGGIGAAARHGVLVKGANYLEQLNRAHTVVFDKTGTLTRGVFRVASIHPVSLPANELLRLAATAEAHSLHPIAQSLREACDAVIHSVATDVAEQAGEGVTCRIGSQRVAVGNDRLMKRLDIPTPALPRVAGTVVHVAVDQKYEGYLVIADEVKSDAAPAISDLRRAGVQRVLMFTGDRREQAETVAAELGLDAVKAELLPHEKVEHLEQLAGTTAGTLVFVGDGMNDAPVLARADVGVAMGTRGVDAAIEAADVVLLSDEPSRLVTAIRVARRTQVIVWQNVALALAVKVAVLGMGTAGVTGLWEAVFADVGVALLAVLNSVRVVHLPGGGQVSAARLQWPLRAA